MVINEMINGSKDESSQSALRNLLVIFSFRLMKTLSNLTKFKASKIKSDSVKSISAEEIAQLKKNGILVLPNFYNASFCTAALHEIDLYLSNNSVKLNSNSDYRIHNSELVFKSSRQFYSHDLLQKVGCAYMGMDMINKGCLTNIVLSSTSIFGSGGGWHRDSTFPQFKALLYLSDVETTEHGAFQYYSGSHKLRSYLNDTIRISKSISKTRWEPDEIAKAYRNAEPTTVLGRAGTLVLFDTCLLHRGSPNDNGSGINRYAFTNYYHSKIGNFGRI
jgi:hypothetical protein